MSALRSVITGGAIVVVASGLTAAAQTLLVTGKHPSIFIESIGPTVRPISFPSFSGAHAIWGATGQDSRGHIWFGVTAQGAGASAHLFEYDPDSDRAIDRGNVLDQLAQAGVLRRGEEQAKIHSRIVQGPDDYLYFASMDEDGESEDGSRLPTWGGHLWRLKLQAGRWEHLKAVPEALIAVAGGGRFIYALGYYGHVLYRFDTSTQDFKRVVVGSVRGHVSRNLIVDYRGHAYVPRLESGPIPESLRVSIVEYDSALREVNATPIEPQHYVDGNPTDAHGIIGIQEMADRSWYFTTHVGFLFHIVPPAPGAANGESPATVGSIGWFDPNGRAYVASLFTVDGAQTLLGLARDSLREGSTSAYHWLTCDLGASRCRVAPFAVAGIPSDRIQQSALYGSVTHDAQNHFYVVGVGPMSTTGDGPILLSVIPRPR